MAGWQDAPIVQAASSGKSPWELAPIVEPAAPSFMDRAMQVVGNLFAGGVRGAGSIGATGVEGARDLGAATLSAVPPNMRPDVTAGAADLPRGDALRTGQDAALRTLGADPSSLAFRGGKLATEVAGTLGVGGVLGKAAEASKMAAPVVEALATGGMRAGGATGLPGIVARAAGGAAGGATAAGMVDPASAGTGALIGGVVPVAVKGAGSAAGAIGEWMSGAVPAAQQSQKLGAAQAGAQAGFVVPPLEVKPGILSNLLQGFGGKIKTAQVASERNQAVTDRLARQALGLDDGAELTVDALQQLRTQAGGAYQALRGAGQIAADDAFLGRLDQIGAVSRGAARSFPGLPSNGVDDILTAVRQPTFDAGDAIDATMYLRDVADKAFRQGDTMLGRAAKNVAAALEDQMERHLVAAGNPEAVNAFRAARQQIAKTYSVQAALNPQTGSVSAPQLAKQLAKGKPLSGELRQVAEFSQAFPRATQALKEPPGTWSVLDIFGAGVGTGVAGPMGAAGLAARPAARSLALSGPVQRMLLKPPTPEEQRVLQILFRDQVAPLAVRAAPVLGANP